MVLVAESAPGRIQEADAVGRRHPSTNGPGAVSLGGGGGAGAEQVDKVGVKELDAVRGQGVDGVRVVGQHGEARAVHLRGRGGQGGRGGEV